MIEKFCNFLTNRIRKAMPEVDDERAEVINYGLQNIVGEVPKILIVIAIAYLLGIGNLCILTVILLLPYRSFSGGFHLHTHLGCVIATATMYCGIPLISKYVLLEPVYIKYIVTLLVWIFGLIMIKLYAPADTENVPVLRKKDRQLKQKLSYITLTISLIIGILIKDSTISNILIVGMFVQTLTITRLAYRLTNNKYGYEIYENKELTVENTVAN